MNLKGYPSIWNHGQGDGMPLFIGRRRDSLKQITRAKEVNLDTKNLLAAKDVEKILKCSLPHVYKMAKRGQLPCIRWESPGEGTDKPRTMVRFKLDDVMGFIDQNYTAGT
jgi:hypothetical protein